MARLHPKRLGLRSRQAFGLAGLAGAVLRRSVGRRFPELDAAARLATLPQRAAGLSEAITIRWNDQHVPFVEAAGERDAAIGLGMVHGHLRLAQMELMRRAAYGRIAEIAGRPAVELDRLLRLIDFPRASAGSLALMPAETRAWADGFAEGISAVAASGPAPPEFDILGISPSRWTAQDLFAVSRLCSADYAWKVWRTLNKLRYEPDWAHMWADLVGVSAVADEDIPIGADNLDEALSTAFTRSGSNAWAVSGSRTRSGRPILACDPHHLVLTPGLWLIAGFRTPQVSVWGFMIPALPIFAPGRNLHGAWGGTNLHATSSELVDVEREAIEERTVPVKVRGRSDVTLTLRESRLGPIVSDAEPFHMPAETVALHWLGHRPSDEFTPFRKLVRARDWDSFEDAVDGYALPGLNMLWAGNDGTIGKMIAAHVPRRPLHTPDDIITSVEAAHEQWAELVSGRDLPKTVDPNAGYVASANEEPEESPVTISLFFAADFRARRIGTLLTARTDLTAEDMKGFQTDVYLAPADALARRLAARLEADGHAGPLVDALAGWDGQYRADSRGALAFELLARPLVDTLEARSPAKVVAPYWRPFTRLTRLVEQADDALLGEALGVALRSAQKPFARHHAWGDIHRVRLAHPLTKLPWLAPRLPTIDFATGGTNETLMKSMHPFTQERHATNFAANARFVADLSDPDGTWAVLLGGQDGWPGSRTMFDQVGPWRRGEHIRLPMSPEALAAAFPRTTTIRPHHA